MLRKVCLAILALFVGTSVALGQYPGTGVYAFGSYDNKGFDSINLGNLNVHFAIPIVNKPGRGMNFSYALNYDGIVWAPSTSAGTGYWQPDGNWGFYGQLGEAIRGYISYSQSTKKCFANPPSWFWATSETNYEYHDQFGAVHLLNYSYDDCTSTVSGDGSTSDGSGIRFDGAYIHLRNGTTITPSYNSPGSSGTMNDTNGNIITNNGNGTFTDTTGTTELTISGGGNASSPLTFTYPVFVAGTAGSATATVYYRSYTVQTNFGCPGISEYSASSISLVDHITLADSPSDTYTFTYEQTPGVSGAVTGRLASITLPAGGTISYSYSGGCSGGINMDGTPATLVRATSDGQKTYTRNLSGAPASTTYVADEKGNETDFNFISDTNGNTFETSRSVYQGPYTGQNPLEAKNTAYNSLTPSTQITPPITQTSITDQYNGQKPVLIVTNYQSGLPTSATIEDPSNGNAALLASSTSYNAYGEVTSSQTTDPQNGNAVVTSVTYGYDETAPTATSGLPQHNSGYGSAGNQTSAHISTGSGTLNSSTAYYDTGTPVSTTAPGGFTTNYSYDSTQTFATQATLPTPSSGVSITTSASYDMNSGVQKSTSDPNNQQTTVLYDNLLRATQVNMADGGQTTYTYTPTQLSTVTKMSATQSSDQETFLDGYGRTKRVAIANGAGWYLADYCYDAAGLLQYQSTPYYSSSQNPGSTACSSSTATQYSYDALGRKTQVNQPDGSSISLTYTARAVQSSDSNGVSRITQYDLLGRISAVCEISGNTLPGSGSPQPCVMDIGGNGYKTSYSYNLSTRTTTITQGVQTRIFQTDAAGRTTYVLEPESGATTYSYTYNSTGLVMTRNRPKANQLSAGVQTTTTSQFDSLGRLVSVNYSDGTPSRNYLYDANGGFAAPQSNLKGRLSLAWASTSPNFTGTVFSYDAVGRIIGLSECFPWTCGTPGNDRNLLYTYDLAGNLTSSTDGNNVMTSYSFSPAGEVQGITSSLSDANHPGTLVSNVQNGPFGPLGYTLGNGISQVNTYDGLGRPSASSVCPSAPGSIGCSGRIYGFTTTWQGTQLKSSTDSVTGNFNYTYDEFNRLTGTANASGPFYTYTYDRWGNRTSQTPSQGGFTFTQPFDTAHNQVNGTGFTYDAAGNLTSDGANSYVYDAEGNVIQQGSSTYIYDALNRQVGQGFSNPSFVGTGQVFDKDGNFTSLWLVSTSNSLSVIGGKAYWNGKALEYYNSNSAFFEHRDWVGTRRATTNSAATVTNLRTSLPFGDGAANVSGGQDNTFDGYTGLWNGGSSATNHAQFREYWNVAGRWLQPDPYSGSYDFRDPQSLNRYSYALNSPLSNVDPTGLFTACDWGDGTWDDTPEDGGATEAECDAGGGAWTTVSDSTSVTVNATPDPPSIFVQVPVVSVDPGTTSIPHDGGGSGPSAPSKPWNANRPNCWAVGAKHVLNAVVNTFDPAPSLSGLATDLTQNGAASGSLYMGVRAQVYAATAQNTKGGFGLISPLKSSIYRGKTALAADLSKVAGEAILAGLDVNLLGEIYDELKSPEPCR